MSVKKPRHGAADSDSVRSSREARIYDPLPKSVATQLKMPSISGSTTREVAVGVFKGMIENQGMADKIIESKLMNKVVMLDSTFTPPSAKLKRAPTMGRKKKKAIGFFEIPERCRRYELYEPLHELWTQYIQEATQLNTSNASPITIQQSALKADLHGCKLCVVRSKKPSLVGRGGIVLQETENTFRIVCENNTIIMVPKKDSVFAFRVGKFTFTIFGNHFRLKPAERISRKFKTKATVDL